MKSISRIEMKKIKGGVEATLAAGCCSVTCSNGEKRERECGDGKNCTTNSTTICCGTDCINMCTW